MDKQPDAKLKTKDIKIAIARCALSGITMSLQKLAPELSILDCDRYGDEERSVYVVLTVGDNAWPRIFEFTVRELQK